MDYKIGFVGAGKMVSAIVKSLLNSNSFSAHNISCCSANDGTSDALSKETGISRFENFSTLISEKPDILVLGCKPQQLAELPDDISQKMNEVLILSIMAGITLDRLKQKFPLARNIVRSMPNTPGLIGAGITGFIFAKDANLEDKEIIQKVLGSLGKLKLIDDEKYIDDITAISGSGPAYLFEFTCAIENAALEIGLEKKLAKDLAIQTIVGSAKLIEKSNLHPQELRDQVTSPNGTTQAALESFSNDQLRNIIARAVKSARDRSRELSNA